MLSIFPKESWNHTEGGGAILQKHAHGPYIFNIRGGTIKQSCFHDEINNQLRLTNLINRATQSEVAR